jgi:ParB/RepB/Spo0J family partition protein
MSLLTLKISDIRENPNALRPVNRQTEEYLSLVSSIKRDGILNPIVVRECKDPETGETFYSLVDGLHRFSAAKDAGLDTIPVHCKEMADAQVLEAQILANVHKIETQPVQYSKALVRILTLNPLMTMVELAERLSKSPKWIADRLSLTKLIPEIQHLVDEDKINLTNAYSLAKLPADEQANFLDRSMTMKPEEFLPTVNNRVKELREASRQGRDPNKEFEPIAILRKMAEIKEEMTSKAAQKLLLSKVNPQTVEEAFSLAVSWVLHLDPVSVQAQIDRDKQRKEELATQKEQRKKERELKQRREAAALAATL